MAPELVRFFDRYRMRDDLVNQALVMMRETRDRSGAKAARDFLRKHRKLWKTWVPAEVAARVEASL